MHDIVQINTQNQRTIDKGYTKSAEHPHAVVVYDGLNARDVMPAISKSWADEAAAAINAARRVGVRAEVI